MIKSSEQSKSNRGGARPGSGRKDNFFRKQCALLANSPKFFKFAKQVFDRQKVEPRLTKDGEIVYLEASVGDMVYLWEKLAAYGFGKPTEFDPKTLVAPLQQVINDTQALKLLYGLNYADRARTNPGGEIVLASRVSSVQTRTPSNGSV